MKQKGSENGQETKKRWDKKMRWQGKASDKDEDEKNGSRENKRWDKKMRWGHKKGRGQEDMMKEDTRQKKRWGQSDEIWAEEEMKAHKRGKRMRRKEQNDATEEKQTSQEQEWDTADKGDQTRREKQDKKILFFMSPHSCLMKTFFKLKITKHHAAMFPCVGHTELMKMQNQCAVKVGTQQGQDWGQKRKSRMLHWTLLDAKNTWMSGN